MLRSSAPGPSLRVLTSSYAVSISQRSLWRGRKFADRRHAVHVMPIADAKADTPRSGSVCSSVRNVQRWQGMGIPSGPGETAGANCIAPFTMNTSRNQYIPQRNGATIKIVAPNGLQGKATRKLQVGFPSLLRRHARRWPNRCRLSCPDLLRRSGRPAEAWNPARHPAVRR